MGLSGIAWTDFTINGWEGCTKISPGCENCFAKDRDDWIHKGAHWGPGAPRKRMAVDYWKNPAKWERAAANAKRMMSVFAFSLADICDPEGLELERKRFWEKVDLSSRLRWLILTKRPELWPANLPPKWFDGWNGVWLGFTAENQEMWDKRLFFHHKVPQSHNRGFASLEPLLGPIDIRTLDPIGVDWVIIGGESGKRARPMDLDWVRRIIGDCQAQNIPVFVKQMGAVWAAKHRLSGAAEDPKEWPPDLRIREFPWSDNESDDRTSQLNLL